MNKYLYILSAFLLLNTLHSTHTMRFPVDDYCDTSSDSDDEQADTDNELLIKAAKANDLALAHELLERGAEPNAKPFPGGDTALHEAVYRNFPGMVELLLSCGANPLLKNVTGYTSIDVTLFYTGNREIQNLLAKHVQTHGTSIPGEKRRREKRRRDESSESDEWRDEEPRAKRGKIRDR